MEDYKVIPFEPKFLQQTVEVLKHLWGSNVDKHVDYFEWKYYDNPYTNTPLGIVAINNGNVVGFRGYFAEKWWTKNKEIDILVAGDTCVAPEHRRKGLSIEMGYKAMDEYSSDYEVFLNFAATPKSVPGYNKLGFLPLVDKYELERYAHRDDLNVANVAGRFEYGQFGDILVLDRPRASELSKLIERDHNRFSLSQDEKFFEWRYRNNKNKYVFCYCIENSTVCDYVIFGTENDFRKGRILDYSGKKSNNFEKILEHAIDSKFFDVISIGDFDADLTINGCLTKLGFKVNSEIHRPVMPVLVRPSTRIITEDDWFIEGLDIRKLENWKIKDICSEWY